MAPQPVVTGLSPKEGPPGTRVIIRGEFLGSKPTDLIGGSLRCFLKEVYCVRHLNLSDYVNLLFLKV